MHLHLFLSFTRATVSWCPLTSQLLHPHQAVCLSILPPPSISQWKSPCFCQLFPRLPACLQRPYKSSPCPCRVSQRLIKLSWSLTRHWEKERGWVWYMYVVFSGPCSQLRIGSVRPYWLSRGEGLIFRTSKPRGRQIVFKGDSKTQVLHKVIS